MVDIHILHIARLYIALHHTVAGSNPVVDFLLVLEDTCCLVAPEVTDGVSVLCTVELLGIRVYLVGGTVDDTVFCRNGTHLVVVVSEVGAHTVYEVLAYLVVP